MSGIWLRYLPANQAWSFVYGDSILAMGGEGRMIFLEREEAVQAAASCDLLVDEDGRVRSPEPPQSPQSVDPA